MGLGKWSLKHGPGSPGAIAKAITKNYLKLKNEYPEANPEELLIYTLQNRIMAEQRFGFPPLSEEEFNWFIKESNSNLKKFILLIVHRENPEADNVMFNFPELYLKMIEVVDEVVEKFINK